MRHIAQSPYARALGERSQELHPSLRTYFGTVPAGHVGVGEGVFERAGSPRRILWPLLRLLQSRGVAFAGWHADVPFTVRNRTIAGRAIAERTFHLPGGDWRMHDAVVVTTGGVLADELGEPGTVRAAFDLSVEGGRLLLRSTAVGLRIGRLRIRIPAPLAPRIRLTEGVVPATGRQRVEVTIDLPLLGRIYEYAGEFSYRVEEERP